MARERIRDAVTSLCAFADDVNGSASAHRVNATELSVLAHRGWVLSGANGVEDLTDSGRVILRQLVTMDDKVEIFSLNNDLKIFRHRGSRVTWGDESDRVGARGVSFVGEFGTPCALSRAFETRADAVEGARKTLANRVAEAQRQLDLAKAAQAKWEEENNGA